MKDTKISIGDDQTFIESEKYNTQQIIIHLQNYPFIIREILPLHILINEKGESITLPQILREIMRSNIRDSATSLNLSFSTTRVNRLLALEFIRRHSNIPTSELQLTEEYTAKLTKLEDDYRNYQMYRTLIQSKQYNDETRYISQIIFGINKTPLIELLTRRYGWDKHTTYIEDLATENGKTRLEVSRTLEGGKLFLNYAFGTQFSYNDIQFVKSYAEKMILDFDNIHQLEESFFPIDGASITNSIELLQGAYLIQADWSEKSLDVSILKSIIDINSVSRYHVTPSIKELAKSLKLTEKQIRTSIARMRTILRREMYKLEEEEKTGD